jgi:enamine deaminase RidA (YjgF/YER057c/UK114 family)
VVEVPGPAKMVFIAGQIALDKDGKVVGEGDMKAQAEQVFKNLEAALAAAGAKFTDVVKMNTYVTDMDKAPAVREVPREVLRRDHAGEHARASREAGAAGIHARDRGHRRGVLGTLANLWLRIPRRGGSLTFS